MIKITSRLIYSFVGGARSSLFAFGVSLRQSFSTICIVIEVPMKSWYWNPMKEAMDTPFSNSLDIDQ